jgi:hypothetical protein
MLGGNVASPLPLPIENNFARVVNFIVAVGLFSLFQAQAECTFRGGD